MTQFRSQLKIIPEAQSLVAFCTLAFPLLVFANTDQKVKTREPDPVKFYGIEQCQPLMAEYMEWHGKALAIGDSLDKDEFEWLRSDKYHLHQTGSVFSREVKLDEKHSLVIEPEQRISKFIELSVVCMDDQETSDVFGHMAIKVELETGATKLLYYSFHPKLNDIWGEETMRLDPDTVARYFKEFEPFPSEVSSRTDQVQFNAEEDLKRIKGIKPDTLVFNDDEVEFWFDWPSDTLVKTTERVEVKRTELGKTTQDTVNEHYYESVTSNATGEVRVSELADNRDYRFKTTPEEEWKLPDRSSQIKCTTEAKKFEYCWLLTLDNITRHYEFSMKRRKRFALPVDSLYMDEVEQWMDEQLEGIENSDSFRDKMRSLLEQKRDDNSKLLMDSRVYLNSISAHLKKMKVGDVYQPFLEFVLPESPYPQPRRPFTKYSLMEARYIGRVPCTLADDTGQCAKIEIRTKALGPDAQADLKREVIKNDIQMDFTIEPHTLLVHEAHYRFLGEAKLGSDSDTVGKTTEIEISVFNSFEAQ